MQADMAEMFQFCIMPVDKTEKDVQINALRDTIRKKKIRVLKTKCPTLIHQLRNASYAANRKDYVRDEDDELLSHCDLLAALVYGHRRALWKARPSPIEGLTVGGVFIPAEDDDTLEVIDVQEYRLTRE
jgi:hypothetical protein